MKLRRIQAGLYRSINDRVKVEKQPDGLWRVTDTVSAVSGQARTLKGAVSVGKHIIVKSVGG